MHAGEHCPQPYHPPERALAEGLTQVVDDNANHAAHHTERRRRESDDDVRHHRWLRVVADSEGDLRGVVALHRGGDGMDGLVKKDHDRRTDHKREAASKDDLPTVPTPLIHIEIIADRRKKQ